MQKRKGKVETLQAGKKKIVPLAKRIRRLYILERDRFESRFRKKTSMYEPGNSWDGGRHKGKLRSAIWPKIAEFFTAEKIEDPEDYVRYLFEQAASPPPMPPRPPMPNHLLSEEKLSEYHSNLFDRRRMIDFEEALGLRRMMQNFLNECEWYLGDGVAEPGDAAYRSVARCVLLDRRLEMNELFRFCIGANFQLSDVRDAFEQVAAYKYIPRRHAYDQAWGPWIPDEFKRKANALYEQTCQELLANR